MLPYIKVLLCYYDARVWAPPLKGGRGGCLCIHLTISIL